VDRRRGSGFRRQQFIERCIHAHAHAVEISTELKGNRGFQQDSSLGEVWYGAERFFQEKVSSGCAGKQFRASVVVVTVPDVDEVPFEFRAPSG
jgi:hypothetical protein